MFDSPFKLYAYFHAEYREEEFAQTLETGAVFLVTDQQVADQLKIVNADQPAARSRVSNFSKRISNTCKHAVICSESTLLTLHFSGDKYELRVSCIEGGLSYSESVVFGFDSSYPPYYVVTPVGAHPVLCPTRHDAEKRAREAYERLLGSLEILRERIDGAGRVALSS